MNAPSQASQTPVAELRGVSVVFPGADGNDVVALNQVSMTIGAGEIVCLVGPSGCGKTTAQNLFAGFLSPSIGEVLVDRQPVTGASPDRTVVFQGPTLFPWLSVERNITLASRKRGIKRHEYSAKARHLIGSFGLAGFERAYPHQLSGGMRQRAQIARALMADPTLLLMDEPFGALDSLTRLKMQQHLLKFRDELTCSILFITHDVDEAIYLGDRVYVMSARPGRVSAEYGTSLGGMQSLDAFNTDEFNNLKQEILTLLHAADDADV
jgi:ABC-type nitrate/sulfonate/bicarbonate transport system ATPase subunit